MRGCALLTPAKRRTDTIRAIQFSTDMTITVVPDVEHGIQAAILSWHSTLAVACMDVAAEYQISHIFSPLARRKRSMRNAIRTTR
jgi:hypothetical protein